MKQLACVLLLIGFLAPSLTAAPPTDLFTDAQALLTKRCGECHGEKAPKARLTLTTAAGLVRGGRKGIVVQAGKPDESLLWKMVATGEMPPKNPLPPAEREVLKRWIEAGAPGLPALEAGHWAFRPLRKPTVPKAPQSGLRNPIDHFITAALEARQLELSPEAGRASLLRRAAFDLTGLPPTPDEIDAFLADTSPDAFDRMVERYLASPHYGERWGKHWLDAAGYADSNGYFNADSDRPLAWKYRDYVIKSFNTDKPFDRFVQEQLAGDELAGHVPGGDVTSAMVEQLVATHFLRNAPDGTGESDGNPDEVRIDRFTVIEGNLQIAMNSLLGLTIQCARCHAHKFEPISHEEYYQLQAILFPVYRPEQWVKPNDRTVSVASRQQREEHRRLSERVDRLVKALQAGLATLAAPYHERLIEERLQTLAIPLREEVLAAVRRPKKELTAEQQALLKQHVEPLKLTEDDAAKRFPEFAGVREQVRKAVAAAEKERPAALEKLSVVVETDPRPPAHQLLVRGQHNQPGKEVRPGTIAALTTPANLYTIPAPPPTVSSGRRTAFARWVTSPENPLFARVYVNRIWQHHFGTGLVATPDNFGISGARPSHPELLDWLAAEFVAGGYSTKHLHRLILGSATWRQTTSTKGKTSDAARAIDPDNRLLASFPLRRLDAEALRDGLLAVSGELDRRAGGPYVPTKRTPEGNVEVDEANPHARRRSVYLQQRRTQVDTFLELFDAPAVTVTCGKRTTSTVPLQALALLNADFTRRRATAFADRLVREAGTDIDARLARAFRLALGRAPRDDERAVATRFLEKQQALYGAAKNADMKAWTDLCQILLASNAFLCVD